MAPSPVAAATTSEDSLLTWPGSDELGLSAGAAITNQVRTRALARRAPFAASLRS